MQPTLFTHGGAVAETGKPILAEKTWFLRGTSEQVAAVLAELPFARPISEDLLELDFGNSVGEFLIPGIGSVEVQSGKWSRRDFDQMLSEVSNIASSLPFSFQTGGALPYQRSGAMPENVLYHAFVYMRSVLIDERPATPERDLQAAYRAVLRDPHRRLEVFTRDVLLHEASRASSRTLEDVLSGRQRFVLAPKCAEIDGLRNSSGANVLPESVSEEQVRDTLDTPENRFLKAFLAECETVLRAFSDRLETCGRTIANPELLRRDADRMRAVLQDLSRHGAWRSIGKQTVFPAASTVLHRRAGYREIFQHFVRMRLSSRIALSPRDARRLLELKDVALLYELWCYFQVVDALRELLGRPSMAELAREPEEVDVPWGHAVTWACGIRAEYNASFRRGAIPERASTSLNFRPDISLWVPGPAGLELHLLDAKFRLDRWDTSKETDAASEAFGLAGYKDVDLHKMHAYRDAIPDAESCVGLFPGSIGEFFESEAVKTSRVAGVGMIPLRPASGRAELIGHLRRIMESQRLA